MCFYLRFTGVNTGGVGSYIYDKEVNAEAQPWSFLINFFRILQHHYNHIHFLNLTHSHVFPRLITDNMPVRIFLQKKWCHVPRLAPWAPNVPLSFHLISLFALQTFWLTWCTQFDHVWFNPCDLFVIYIYMYVFYLCIISVSQRLSKVVTPLQEETWIHFDNTACTVESTVCPW